MELQFLYSVLCVAFLILAFNISTKRLKQPKNLPPSPLALPIIGHLHLLKHPLHRAFYALSRKHGPVLSLRFGSRRVLLVSSPSVAQECFTKNDIVFANRPSFFLYGKYINYNNTTLGAASYGDHWRNLRRLSTIEIFSSVRLNSFLAIRKDEVKILMRRLNRLSAASGNSGYAKVEMRPMLSDLTFNIILRIIAGKRYYGEDVDGLEEGKQFREIMTEISELAVATNIGDLIPMFQWIGYSKRVNKLVQLSKKMNAFFEMLIDEHESDEGRNTMVSHLLALQESQPEYYTDEIIKGLMLIMLQAGTRTTSIALEWIISNLLNHPDVLNKSKTEIDTQIGPNKLIDEPDFSKLHYLQCVIMESLRLCPVFPLLMPHTASQDCTVGGYKVSSGTMLFVNAWAIHRDPNLWTEPTEFKPERFENEKEAHKLMSFGMGRRACPGEGLANRVMILTLASLIQCFDLQRVCEKKIDMTEKSVMSMYKAKPLEMMCKARPNASKILS